MISWLLLLHIAVAKKKGVDKWEEKVDSTGRKSQKIEIQAPVITEAEQYGVNLPVEHHCYGCIAVLYQLNASLAAIATPNRLKSWQYVDAFEHTCQNAFEGYGVSNIKGVNTLTGPGIEAKSDGMANIQMGGDRWKGYMSSFCKLIVSEIGDEELYEHYFQSRLNIDLCSSSEMTYCKDEKAKKAKKPKKSTDEATKNPPTTKKSLAQFLRDQEIADGVKDGEYSNPRRTEEWHVMIKTLAAKLRERQEL